MAVLIKAPAKRRKGSKGYFSIMGYLTWVVLIGNYTILGISTLIFTEKANNSLLFVCWMWSWLLRLLTFVESIFVSASNVNHTSLFLVYKKTDLIFPFGRLCMSRISNFGHYLKLWNGFILFWTNLIEICLISSIFINEYFHINNKLLREL